MSRAPGLLRYNLQSFINKYKLRKMVSDDNRPGDDDDDEYESKLSTRSHVHRLARSTRNGIALRHLC